VVLLSYNSYVGLTMPVKISIPVKSVFLIYEIGIPLLIQVSENKHFS